MCPEYLKLSSNMLSVLKRTYIEKCVLNMTVPLILYFFENFWISPFWKFMFVKMPVLEYTPPPQLLSIVSVQ